MTISSKLRVIGQVAGLNSGGVKTIDLTGTDLASDAQVTSLVLQSGANTIAVPARASFAVIVFAPTSTVTKTLKGVTGDTGIVLAPAGFAVVSFNPASPAASFVITASATDTGLYTEIIFV